MRKATHPIMAGLHVRAKCTIWPWLVCLLSINFLCLAPSLSFSSVGPRRASVGEAVEEARRTGIPADWLRILTVADASASGQVAQAVMAISEGLQLEATPVMRLRKVEGELESMEAETLALQVPPKSMVLVCSMMGEALGDEPMILVENLDMEEGDAAFFRGELTGEDLPALATDLLQKGLVALVELDEEGGRAAVHTTGAGKQVVEELLPKGLSAVWTPVGGNSEYLSWIEKEVTTSN